MAQLNFNARNVAPDQGFEVYPAGWYNAQIEESGMKPTSDGQGAYLEMGYRILDGKYVNRKIKLRLNLQNNNQQTVQIAYGQLSAICHATGVLDCLDSQLLHGIPHKIKITLRDARTDKDTGKHYEASNEVRGWKNINEQVDEVPTAGGGAPQGFGVPPGFAAPQQAAPGWGAAPQQPQAPQQAPQQPAQPPQQAQPWAAQPGAAQPQQPAAQPWAAAPQQPPAGMPPAGVQPPWGAAPAGVQPPAGATMPAGPQGGAAPPWQR